MEGVAVVVVVAPEPVTPAAPAVGGLAMRVGGIREGDAREGRSSLVCFFVWSARVRREVEEQGEEQGVDNRGGGIGLVP